MDDEKCDYDPSKLLIVDPQSPSGVPLLQPVVKAQGLKKGETVENIGGPIRVVSVERAPLNAITPQDVHREGFPQMTREQFIAMFKKSHKGCRVGTVVTRIEFEYM